MASLSLLAAGLDWHACFFAMFAAVAVAFAIAVVATDNVVRMAFYLTICLGSTAGLFFLAGAQFLGAMQFMIYVGGTLVLLIFGVMLTAQSRFISMKTAAGEWIAGGVLGFALLVMLVRSAWSVDSWNVPRVDRAAIATADVETSSAIGLGLVGIRVDSLDETTSPAMKRGMSGYLLPFVVVSVHLLVVLIGAGYLARTKGRSRKPLATQAVAQVERKRDFFAMIGMVKGMVLNGLAAMACFAGPAAFVPAESTGWLPKQLVAISEASPAWLFPGLGLLFIANVLCLGVVWCWQKWGATGLVLIPLVQAFSIGNSPLGTIPAIVFLVVMLVPVVALISLLFRGGGESMWAKME